MTTAIEQAKREMYEHLQYGMYQLDPNSVVGVSFGKFESSLEAYLEQLRQQYEEMASTARQRFESIQSLEAANAEIQGSNKRQGNVIASYEREVINLQNDLAKMTESRDMFRNLHQAATHASIGRVGQASTSGQTSGDRASCERPDAKTMAILGALVDAQRVMVEYLVPDGIRAKDAIGKLIPILDNERLYTAMRGFERPVDGYASWFIRNTQCQHSFFAIGDAPLKCTFCGVGK